MKTDNKNLIVKHHNYINESIFNFNSLELNAFISIIFKVEKAEKSIVFNIDEIKKYFNSKDRSFKAFHDILKRLQKQNIELKTDNGYKSIMPFPVIDFNLNEKTVEIHFNELIIPYLGDLKEKFTLYSIDEFLALNHKHSKRLFQLLKQYNSVGYRTIKIDFLKKVLAVDYSRFYDFERFVLKKSIDEINQFTTLNVEYEKIKKGREIESVKFYLNKNSNESKQKIENYENRITVIKRALETFEVKTLKELTEVQKKILNVTLIQKGFNKIR
ncbi:MAG: replication initiation protein [Fusobacteriaceae bacterium]|nr:replication initiation protein [Fusobacteriaceae bacterium]